MSMKFQSYFLMKEGDVIEYVKEKGQFFNADSTLMAKEIGDGNLNYVFRVKDNISGKSIIVKQAAEEARISKKLRLSKNRGEIEAKTLLYYKKIVPGYVPEVYMYDRIMCVIIMEDIIGYEVMRKSLMSLNIYPKFADKISTFLVKTLLFSSDFCMNHKQKRNRIAEFTNLNLYELTENLVFTDPYNDINNQNEVLWKNRDFVQKEIYDNKELHLEVADLKYKFMNNVQALIHGDLHTGSMFINENHLIIFDPEFSFYGPMGYDIGNVIAHLIFSWCYGHFAAIAISTRKEKFCHWILNSIVDIVDMFIEKFNRLYDNNVNDCIAKTDGFKERCLNGLLRDTAGYAGIECIRRIIGLAKVIEITEVTDVEIRIKMERVILRLGVRLIKNRNLFMSGNDYRNAILEAVK